MQEQSSRVSVGGGTRGIPGLRRPGGHPGIRLCLLGCFEAWADGEVAIDHSWPHRKAKAVLKLTALQDARRLHREQIYEALWPSLEPAAARNNLHKSLFHLRQAFAARGVKSAVVSMRAEMVVLSGEVVLDIDDFRRLAEVARFSRDGAMRYEEALSLYVGDLLLEDLYEEWAQSARHACGTSVMCS